MGKIRESDLERQVLHQLAGLGWVTVFGPDIAPGEPGAERSDYREVVLRGRLRRALSSLNPEVPGEALDEAAGLSEKGISQLREKGVAASRQLAKRQLTWLRSMPQRTVVQADGPQDPITRVVELAQEYLLK